MNGTPNWHKFRYGGIVVSDFYNDNGLRYFNTNKTIENPTDMIRSPFYILVLRI